MKKYESYYNGMDIQARRKLVEKGIKTESEIAYMCDAGVTSE